MGAVAPCGAICKQIRAYPLCGAAPRNAPRCDLALIMSALLCVDSKRRPLRTALFVF